MAKCKINWADVAKNDFKETLEFYNRRNGNKTFSRKLFRKIRSAISLLRTQPFIGKSTDDKFVRVLSIDGFQIYYEVHEDNIDILTVWDIRRNPDDLNISI